MKNVFLVLCVALGSGSAFAETLLMNCNINAYNYEVVSAVQLDSGVALRIRFVDGRSTEKKITQQQANSGVLKLEDPLYPQYDMEITGSGRNWSYLTPGAAGTLDCR